MSWLDKLNPITAIVGGAKDLINSFKLPPEKQVEFETHMRELELNALKLQQDREKSLVAEQSKIIRAEIDSGSWLASNWRPIVMLTLTACVVLHWVGVTPENLPAEQVDDLMDIVKIGLGGYVVGRSGEKITKAWKNGEKS